MIKNINKYLEKNLYLKSGYVNIKAIADTGYTYICIVGGRGTGKTYGALDYVLNRNTDKKFVFMRRTDKQLKTLMSDELSPIKALNMDKGYDIVVGKIADDVKGFYNSIDGKPAGSPLAYCFALSTIHNFRGFDARDADVIVYDEFIPEAHARPIKDEYQAFKNAYETINRNRELTGERPVQCLCLANSNRLANPLFMGMKVINDLKKAQEQGKSWLAYPKRSLLIIMLKDSIISKKKANTALYMLDADDEYSRMALNNEFTSDDYTNVNEQPLKEYKCISGIGEIYIWKHKSKSIYYVCQTKAGNPDYYSNMEVAKFKRSQWRVYDAYYRNRVYFDSYLTKAVFMEYIGIKG